MYTTVQVIPSFHITVQEKEQFIRQKLKKIKEEQKMNQKIVSKYDINSLPKENTEITTNPKKITLNDLHELQFSMCNDNSFKSATFILENIRTFSVSPSKFHHFFTFFHFPDKNPSNSPINFEKCSNPQGGKVQLRSIRPLDAEMSYADETIMDEDEALITDMNFFCTSCDSDRPDKMNVTLNTRELFSQVSSSKNEIDKLFAEVELLKKWFEERHINVGFRFELTGTDDSIQDKDNESTYPILFRSNWGVYLFKELLLDFYCGGTEIENLQTLTPQQQKALFEPVLLFHFFLKRPLQCKKIMRNISSKDACWNFLLFLKKNGNFFVPNVISTILEKKTFEM